MYAPTWEGENDSNNYTSVDKYGVDIVRAVLSRTDTRLIYKPHPQVGNSQDEEMITAHQTILRLIDQSNEDVAGGQPHRALLEGDILGMFSRSDLLITDISSVGLDFLYLHPDKPIILTDRRSDTQRTQAEAPISRATPVLDATNLHDIAAILNETLTTDERGADRAAMRIHYFGDGEPGDSIAKFLQAITTFIARRNEQLSARSTEHSTPDDP